MRLRWALCWVAMALLACGGQSSGEVRGGNGGKTNWLKSCETKADCDGQQLCADGACLPSCSGDADCADLSPSASCAAAALVSTGHTPSCEQAETQRVCAVSCERDADCDQIGLGFSCLDGSCQAASCNAESEAFDGCVEGDTVYADGEAFPHSDDCNTCRCEGGSIDCTMQECDEPLGLCAYEGSVYESGDSFTTEDGCTACVCDSGDVSCDDSGYEEPPCEDCEPESECESDADCPDICARDSCDAPGHCEERGPALCNDDYDPVCGCDGTTYDNACFAAGRGIAHAGACDEDCPSIYAPVCGVDGQTYGNACTAGAVEVAHEGVCAGDPCETDDECGEFAACLRASCEGPGECVENGMVGCVEDYEPVCGCDGNTYDNACFAAGVGVAAEGECGGGCQGDADCGDGQWCRPIECDGPGQCVADDPTAGSCEVEYDPVCGCDGETYDNACFAERVGVRSAGLCDGSCLRDTDCPSGEACSRAACGQAGECAEISYPTRDFDEDDPVCSCDGVTYQSSAIAGTRSLAGQGACEVEFTCLDRGHRYGIGFAFDRDCNTCECDGEDIACTDDSCENNCSDDGDCAADLVCNQIGCTGRGRCESLVTRQCNGEQLPTCGCDGETYDSQCDALAVGVAHLGACGFLGCGSDAECAPGDYCVRDSCDEPGICQTIDVECMEQPDAPVCGCEGTTYRNACEAGTRAIAFGGACP